MQKSITKEQKVNEDFVRETINHNFHSFKDLYNFFYPKHFWQNVNTSWQKESDDFFKSFKNEREYFEKNYKEILIKSIQKEIIKKQLKKSLLNSYQIYEKKVFLMNNKIITVYFSCEKNKTIGIFQKIEFRKTINDLELNKRGLLAPSSLIGCFCIKKSGFKNF